MAFLTRDQILQADDLKSSVVSVPEWGGDVRVRMLTGAERDAIGQAMLDADGKVDPSAGKYREMLVATAIVGEDGAQLFTLDDVRALAGKSAIALQRVFAEADRLNSLSTAAVEDAAKNLPSAPSAASS